jgi:hypothetical protein
MAHGAGAYFNLMVAGKFIPDLFDLSALYKPGEADFGNHIVGMI